MGSVMSSAFEDNQFWEKFKKELLSWKGTPYRHLQCAKGKGGDCTFFLADVFFKTGIFKKVETPEFYPKDWYLHTNIDVIRTRLEENFASNTVDAYEWRYNIDDGKEELIRGDLALFILRPSIAVNHHCGVYLGNNEMFHGTTGKTFDTVVYDRWSEYRTSYYRLHLAER
jgi:cell wall-associated NlpC family hydrolase